MKNDPVLNEIREVRHMISKQCDHDPKKLVAYYLQRQKHHQSKLYGYNKTVDAETHVETHVEMGRTHEVG